MLVEVWHVNGAVVDVYVPADPANHPERCCEIAGADWRYLARFQVLDRCETANEQDQTPFAQTAYRFALDDLLPLLGKPYPEESDAG